MLGPKPFLPSPIASSTWFFPYLNASWETGHLGFQTKERPYGTLKINQIATSGGLVKRQGNFGEKYNLF